MEYKCISCGHATKETKDASGTLRCTNCGSKIFSKVRQPVAREVKAR